MYSKDTQRKLYDLSKKLLNTPAATTLFSEHPAEILAQLHDVIRYHEWRYYVQNDPVLADFEYDLLYKQLESLEKQHPELLFEDSPTQRVGQDLVGDAKQISHLIPMLSLDNSYDAEDLNDFDESIKKLTGLPKDSEIEYCVEPKFDGGTIVLVFENDKLLRAATRGNGAVGDEITANIRTLRSVPLQTDFSKFGIAKAELRGEALIRKDVFEKIIKAQETAGERIFANPRNAATGALRMKNPNETAARGLEAFVYQMGYAVDNQGNNVLNKFQSHHESIEMLGKLGFKIPHTELLGRAILPETAVCKNIGEVIDFCQKWQEYRDNYGYEIDGMVVKLNSLELQAKCGSTSHHPRWAIAFKFQARQATTRLRDIEFQVGKSGAVTPVAKLEPVALAGVTVQNVSLHNEEFIKTKDIRIGDTVLVERAGDVIPYIVKSLAELRDGSEREVEYPKNCPVCQSVLVKPEGEAIWRCENADCEAQVLARMVHHTSKNAMDIESFGESTIEKFFRLGWLHSIADIYRLDYQKIALLEGFGEKSAANLRTAIEKAKQQPIYRFFYSLSIHHFGKKASKLLAAEVENVLDLKNWDLEKYQEIKDIGPVVARNVFNFFQNEKNIELLETIQSLGVNFKQTEADQKPESTAEGVLAGKTILFTGTLSQMTREEAEKLAAGVGASLASGVSSKLNILVVGEKAGSKLKKATALGTVEIWNETEFLEKIAVGEEVENDEEMEEEIE